MIRKTPVAELLNMAGFQQIAHRQDFGGNDRAVAATKS